MLTWNWKDKIGKWVISQNGKEFELNIYECNGLAVILDEFQNANGEEVYNLYGFFSDKTHLKNCLGLSKDFPENIYTNELLRIELIRCKTSNILASEILKAKWTNDIEIKLISDCPF